MKKWYTTVKYNSEHQELKVRIEYINNKDQWLNKNGEDISHLKSEYRFNGEIPQVKDQNAPKHTKVITLKAKSSHYKQ